MLLAVVLDERHFVDLELLGQILAELVDISDAIDQAGLFGGGGREDSLVDQILDLAAIELAIGGDRVDHLVVVVVDDQLELLAELGAHVGAGHRLGGPFVGPDLHHLGLHAQLVEQLL